jgi:hypothetical protein
MSIPSISSSFRFHHVNTVSSASTPRTQQAQSPAVADTSTRGTGSRYTDSFQAEGPGSRGFGEQLEAALKSAGLDAETVRNVLSTLNGGKGPQESSSLDLLSGLDDESAEQLQQAPDLAQQLSQYPDLFKQLVSQGQQSENTHVDTQSASA